MLMVTLIFLSVYMVWYGGQRDMKFGTRITERGPGALRDGVSTYIGVNWRRKMARVASGVVLRRPTMFILVLQLFSMAHYMRLFPLLIQ